MAYELLSDQLGCRPSVRGDFEGDKVREIAEGGVFGNFPAQRGIREVLGGARASHWARVSQRMPQPFVQTALDRQQLLVSRWGMSVGG